MAWHGSMLGTLPAPACMHGGPPLMPACWARCPPLAHQSVRDVELGAQLVGHGVADAQEAIGKGHACGTAALAVSEPPDLPT
jgi:hypothetical protein